MRRMLMYAFFSHLSAITLGREALDLSGDGWTLTSLDPLNVSVPAHLPSQAHLDLYAAQVIGDPYHGLNDFNLRWITTANWT